MKADGTGSIHFDSWAPRIRAAADMTELTRAIRAYLDAWRPEQLNALPRSLTNMVILGPDDIAEQAISASRAEIRYAGGNKKETKRLLREMALTLATAASRVRALRAERMLTAQAPCLSGSEPDARE